MLKGFSIMAGLVASMLAGCMQVGPKEMEALDTPGAFKTEHPAGDSVDRDDWWTAFEDPELNRLIESAERQSPNLAIALLRVEQAAAIAGIEASVLLPQIDFIASAGRSRLEGVTRNRFFASLELDWEIDAFGRIRRLRNSAQAEARAEADAYDAALNVLRAQVAQTYFGLRSLDRSIGILEATIVIRGDALNLVEIRERSGLSDELEVAQARTEHAVAQAELQRVIGQRISAENALATLCGIYASEFGLEVQPQWLAQLPDAPRAVASELLLRRPDLSQARRLVEAASERIGARQAEFYPSISLGGDFGYEARESNRWFQDASRVWSFGPAVDLPIFQGRGRRLRLQLAELEYRSLMEAYRAQVLSAFEEVETGLALAQQLEREYEALLIASQAARRAAAMAKQRYDSGLVSYLEVVDTERAALTATLRLNDVEVERMNRIAQLVVSLGGGWKSGQSD